MALQPSRNPPADEPAAAAGACSDPISPVDRSVDDAVAAQLSSSVPEWSGLNNPWVPSDDAGVEYITVNLQVVTLAPPGSPAAAMTQESAVWPWGEPSVPPSRSLMPFAATFTPHRHPHRLLPHPPS